MSITHCSLSGQPLTEPVVLFGYIYEKNILIAYLKEHNYICPKTQQQVNESDFITIQPTAVVKPRPISQTTISGLLTSLQKEYEAIMLESSELKMQNTKLKEQLQNALYEQEAALRVIARLTVERDESRSALMQHINGNS